VGAKLIGFTVIAAAVSTLAAIAVATGHIPDPGDYWQGYAIAAVVAATVGATDVLTRYKDNPMTAINTWAAWIYIGINFLLGLAAFWLSAVLGIIRFDSADPHGVKNGLLVGFGAILILRSIAFKISIGGKGGEVGPSTIVDALLATYDQSINRKVALEKDKSVRRLMEGVSFYKASEFLSLYCLSLLQRDDARAKMVADLKNSIADFKKGDPAGDAERAYLLGNMMINNFGRPVTEAVINGFRSRILLDAGPAAKDDAIKAAALAKALAALPAKSADKVGAQVEASNPAQPQTSENPASQTLDPLVKATGEPERAAGLFEETKSGASEALRVETTDPAGSAPDPDLHDQLGPAIPPSPAGPPSQDGSPTMAQAAESAVKP
jgi:hypothetical protein